MSKINNTTDYAIVTPAAGDILIGTDVSNTSTDGNGETVNFTVSSIKAFVLDGDARYATHVLLEAANISTPVLRISYIDPDGKTRSLVRDPSGTAATTADGANWAPDGVGSPYDFGGILDGDMDAVVTDATNEATVYAAFWTWLAAGAGRKGEWPNFRTMRVDALVNGLSGDYSITGGLGSYIDGRNLPNLDASGTGSVLNHAGSVASTQSAASITATVDANGKDIVTVVTDAVHGLAVGDDIMLASDDAASSGGDTTNETRGQMSRVRSVTNTTTFIIQEPLYQLLPTNPVLIKFNWLENIDWDCYLVFVGPGRRSGSASSQSVIGYSGPEFVYGRNIHVENMRTEYLDYQSIIFDACVNYSTLNCSGIVDPVDDPTSAGAIQYFLTDKNGCARGRHGKWHSENYRHAYDHTGNTRRGVAHTLTVEDFYCVGTWRSAIAQHVSAFNSVIRNGKIENCYDGIDIRAPGWTVENIEMNHVRVMVSLSDNALSTTIKGLRGKDVRRVVGLTDTNILLGATEFGELNISDVIVDGCALTAIEIDATNIPVFTEADSAVSAGTTTSMTVGDLDLYAMVTDGAGGFDKFETITQASTGATAYVLNVSGSSVTLQRVTGTFNTTNLLTGSSSGASGKKPTSIATISNYNVTGMLAGVEITVDPDGGGAAAELVRTASHVYDAGANTNTFSWTSAVGTAPTTSATYHIRTIIDGLSITDIDIRNCPTSVVRVFGNFRSPAITNITDNSNAVTTNPTIKLIADASNYCRNAEIRDWTARNKLGPDIDAANTGTRINGHFVDRSTAVEYIASGTIANDEVFRAGALQYIGETSATDISDMDAVVPFGDVTFGHFGAVGDAVVVDGLLVSGTNDAVALQAALTWMSGERGRKLSEDAGAVYRTSAQLSGIGNFSLNLGSGRIFCDAEVRVLDWSATLFGPYDLGANYTAGDTALDMAGSPLAAAPKAGTVMKIVSDAVDPKNRDSGSETRQFRVGETFIVGSGSTTTNVVLARPLRFVRGISPTSTAGDEADVNSYTTALNARVVFADNDERFELVGGCFSHEDGHDADWSTSTMRVRGFVDPLFSRVSVSKGYGYGIGLAGTYRAVVDNPSFEGLVNDVSNGQFGYGVSDAGTMTKVTGLGANDTRHAYTSSVNRMSANDREPRAIISAGRVEAAQINGGHATGGTSAQWDTHLSTEVATFSDTYSRGCTGTSMGVRGRDVSVLGHTSRDCGLGVNFFTEFQSGDTDEDFFTAGKTVADVTSGRARDLDVECKEEPFIASHSIVDLMGKSKFITQDHCALYNNGGILRVTGYHEFTSITGGVVHDRTGCIHINGANSALSSAFPLAKTIIEQGSVVVIDATDADASTVNAMTINTGAELIVRGKLVFKLPSGAGWKSGSGAIRCEGDGVIEYEIAGAADNSIITNAESLVDLRVRSVDGSVRWDDAKRTATGPAFQTFFDSTVGVDHDGTGSEVQDVYNPKGQYAFFAMNARAAGMLRCIITGRKDGTNGDATIVLRSGASNFVESFVIPAAASLFQIEVTGHITGVNSQLYITNLSYKDGAADTVSTGRKPETLSPANGTNPAVSFGINAAVGDSVQIDTCEVWATAGGVL